MKDARARVIELREIVETARKELPQIRVKISSQEKCATKAEKASKDAEEEAEKLAKEEAAKKPTGALSSKNKAADASKGARGDADAERGEEEAGAVATGMPLDV